MFCKTRPAPRKRRRLRIESLEGRQLMAADFDPKYFFDMRDLGGAGETPLVGDFNGDGKADIGVYIPNGTKDARWVVKFNDGKGKFAAGTRYDIDRRDIGGVGETPLVGDFNGDGKSDIGVYIPNGTKDARWVVKFNDGKGKFATGTRYDIDRRDLGGVGETPLVGDFNGDRKADIGVYIPNGTKDARWVIKFNDGKGNFASGVRYDIDRRDIGGVGETPLVGDFDGDRKADIGVYIPNGTKDARWVVKFNDGNGNFAAGTGYDIDRRDIGGAAEKPLVGDFNGDVRADIGVYIPNGSKDARWVVKTGRGGDVLEIVGTPGNDHLVISQTASDRIVIRDMTRGIDVATYPAAQIHTIRVYAADGNDIVDLRGINGQSVTKVGDLHGGNGDDRLYLGNAGGNLEGDQGNDQLFGSNKRDSLFGGSGDDYLWGGAGDDQIFGGANFDRLLGGPGNDVLKGGDGNDWLWGNEGDDYLNGEGGDDYVNGGAGVDTVRRQLSIAGNGLALSDDHSSWTATDSGFQAEGSDGKIHMIDDRGSEFMTKDSANRYTHIQYDQQEGQFYYYDNQQKVYVGNPNERETATPPEEVTGTFLTSVDQAQSATCTFLAVLGATGSRTNLEKSIRYDAQRDLYGVTLYEEIPVVFSMYEQSPMAKAHTVWVSGDYTEGKDPGGSLVVLLYQKAYLEFMNIYSRGANGELLDDSQWTIPANSDWNSSHRAFFALTGRNDQWVNTANADPSTMQKQLQARGTLGMIASSKDSGVSNGIVEHHAYTVIGVFRMQTNWYVRLYNPWGHDGKARAQFDLTDSGTILDKDDGFISLRWDQFKANFGGYSFA